ncbi:MAG: hypothetical protein QY332_16080 [Anaerolineales bacterium]|nr:MAG: hypothetical protein QY332_16080 [Anaerolineales bacterium]
MANFNPNYNIVLDNLLLSHSLDTSRVYVTGASNGEMMTYRLDCETSGVIAGIAPVIANIPEPIFDACTLQESLAFLSINGSENPFILIAMDDAEHFRGG